MTDSSNNPTTQASANSGYTWSNFLQEGDTGHDVEQLQVRVAGYPSGGFGSTLIVDGIYGSGTAAAVSGFQQAYDLTVDGIAGDETFGQIYDLQTSDNYTVHFTSGEWNQYNVPWDGRPEVSESIRRRNALITVWKLEAVRHAIGDQPLAVSSTIRNNDVSAGSRHIYGDAVDINMIDGRLVIDGGFCGVPSVVEVARNHGFREILGPGHPAHDDHIHLAEYVAGTSETAAGAPGSFSTFANHPNC